MAKITKISTQRRKERYNIYLDGQYAFPVSEAVLVKYRLAKGQELDQTLINQIQKAEDQAKAYVQALNYLSYQLRSVAELSDHLQELGIDTVTIEQVIAQLKELNYLNDQEYAQSFVRTAIKTTVDGPQKIKHKLQRKKVAEFEIIKALKLFTPKLMLDNATKLAIKTQHQTRQQPYRAQLNKIRERLHATGYPAEIITQAVSAINLQIDPEHEQNVIQTIGQKLWRRYQKQPNGQQKLYEALARRGFNSDDIHNFLQDLN